MSVRTDFLATLYSMVRLFWIPHALAVCLETADDEEGIVHA